RYHQPDAERPDRDGILQLLDVARREKRDQRIDDAFDQTIHYAAKGSADDNGGGEFHDLTAQQEIPQNLDHRTHTPCWRARNKRPMKNSTEEEIVARSAFAMKFLRSSRSS